MANPDAWAAGWSKGSKKKGKGKDSSSEDSKKKGNGKGSSSEDGAGKSAWSVGFGSKTTKSSYKKGGKVKKTGMAKVHKGEIVLTAAQAKMCAQKAGKGKGKTRKKVSAKKG
jgi:hypothetical protein